MKKRLPEILCMAAVLVGLLALAAQAGAEHIIIITSYIICIANFYIQKRVNFSLFIL